MWSFVLEESSIAFLLLKDKNSFAYWQISSPIKAKQNEIISEVVKISKQTNMIQYLVYKLPYVFSCETFSSSDLSLTYQYKALVFNHNTLKYWSVWKIDLQLSFLIFLFFL